MPYPGEKHSEGASEVCAVLRRFASQELGQDLVRRDREGIFDEKGWQLCARMGIQGVVVPEDYGGQGQDLATSLAMIQTLGEACADNGLIFSLGAQIWSVEMPLLHFGTEEQRRRYLPSLCDGSRIGVHAMTEPDSGSDAFALRTRAIRQGDDYVLSGTKTFATNAPVGDVAIVFANARPELGALGVTAFIVERDMPGVSFGPPIAKMGLRTSPTGEVVLDEVRLPAWRRLGREGSGLQIFQSSMEYERGFIFAAHLGAIQRVYRRCLEYARARRQFGRPIAEFSPIADRLVSMRMDLELGELLLRKIARTKDDGGAAPMEAAMAKLFISESYVRTTLDAVQIFGGYGYTVEYQIEREHRDAVASRIYSGTSEMQRRIIYQYLGV